MAATDWLGMDASIEAKNTPITPPSAKPNSKYGNDGIDGPYKPAPPDMIALKPQLSMKARKAFSWSDMMIPAMVCGSKGD